MTHTNPVFNLLLTQRLGQGLPFSWPEYPCLQCNQLLCCHPETQMHFLVATSWDTNVEAWV